MSERRIPPLFGADANVGMDPKIAACNGVKFVCRYHSDDAFHPMRNLTPEEAAEWGKLKIPIVSVWQNGKSEEVKEGFDAGVRAAKVARVQQSACGGPGQPIYFAVDYATRTGNITPVLDFFQGARSVLGGKRLGVYGTRYTVEALYRQNAATYFWQTKLFFPEEERFVKANLYQYENADITGNNHFGAEGKSYVCYDRAFTYDFGQWLSVLF